MALELQDISYFYQSRKILDNISLTIKEGQFVSIIGPSGCGKTTLLNIMSGFERNYQGNIIIKKEFKGYLNKPLSFMTQKDLLIPFLTIYENLALALKIQKIPKNQIQQKIDTWLNPFKLEKNLLKKPSQLSGGERQRVSLLRAFLIPSFFMLLDEPFCSLDYITRIAFIQILKRLKKEEKKTVVLVTHDIDEALFLSDIIYCINKEGALKESFPITLNREDIYQALISQDFINYKKELIKYLKTIS
jgi:ABC-type nitrate/sulfonate/bicarbonate transport system ATPase subunit